MRSKILLIGIATLVAATMAICQNGDHSPTNADKKLRVAFVVSHHFNMMDFAGPWEVFSDAAIVKNGGNWEDGTPLFETYTVSDDLSPIPSGNASLVAAYSFSNAPAPDLVVIGAQGGKSEQMMEWIRKSHTSGATIMSVCTGAGTLARTGLIDKLPATTHHDFLESFKKNYPNVNWQPTTRYVQSAQTIYTAGGLTSGIDLALHIVALRFGNDVAEGTAKYMEYEGNGWRQQTGKK